ncbi:MAG: hypothetical protein VXW65_11925 [Pseudomonadota bacterium]|nr:hypothetical protein [Pseudomonadota bacterium]
MALGNIFKRFIDLLPKQPRMIGTVIVVHGGGEYTVQLNGGGTLRVTARESYNINNRVYVVDQRIDGLAKNLPTVTIDV